MFTGHAALALLAKRQRPSVPLWLLLAAAYASDGLELLLNLARVPDERVVAMLSHSVAGDVVWGALLGALYWLLRRDRAGAALLGVMVLSHWPADFLTGQHKPTWPGGPWLGLSLYRHNALDFVMEGVLLLAAWALLRRERWVSVLARALPLLLLPVQLGYNVAGHLGFWDWKWVMLRGSRATARAVRDGVSERLPPPRGGEPPRRHAS